MTRAVRRWMAAAMGARRASVAAYGPFHVRSRRAGRLAGGLASYLWLRATPELSFWTGLAAPGRLPVPIPLRSGGRLRRILVWDESELEVVLEVFLDEVYRVRLPGEVRTVLDLGAHTGISALYLADAYPEARIVAVEPNPVALARLARNLRRMGRITVVPAALGESSGRAHLAGSPGPGTWSARLARPDELRGAEVAARSLDDLRREHDLGHIDLLKFDIEGGERHLVPSALSGVRALVGEVHLGADPALASLGDVLSREFVVTRRRYGDGELLVGLRPP